MFELNARNGNAYAPAAGFAVPLRKYRPDWYVNQ